jgi:hypothetical protein
MERRREKVERRGGGQFHAAFNSSEPHAKTRRKTQAAAVGGSASTSTSTSTSTPYIRVHSWFKSHHSRSLCRADLGLESPSYNDSCPFVSIRGSKHPSRSAFRTDLRLVSPSYIYSWFIHVHSWFKKRLLAIIRENPCSSVAKKTPVAPHPRTPVRGSPDEHTPRVISTSRLRVSPNDPKPPALTL